MISLGEIIRLADEEGAEFEISDGKITGVSKEAKDGRGRA